MGLVFSHDAKSYATGPVNWIAPLSPEAVGSLIARGGGVLVGGRRHTDWEGYCLCILLVQLPGSMEMGRCENRLLDHMGHWSDPAGLS